MAWPEQSEGCDETPPPAPKDDTHIAVIKLFLLIQLAVIGSMLLLGLLGK